MSSSQREHLTRPQPFDSDRRLNASVPALDDFAMEALSAAVNTDYAAYSKSLSKTASGPLSRRQTSGTALDRFRSPRTAENTVGGFSSSFTTIDRSSAPRASSMAVDKFSSPRTSSNAVNRFSSPINIPRTRNDTTSSHSRILAPISYNRADRRSISRSLLPRKVSAHHLRSTSLSPDTNTMHGFSSSLPSGSGGNRNSSTSRPTSLRSRCLSSSEEENEADVWQLVAEDVENEAVNGGVQKRRSPTLRQSASSFSIMSSASKDELNGPLKSVALARIASRERAALGAENESRIHSAHKTRMPTLRKSTSSFSSSSPKSLDGTNGLPKSTALTRIALREKAALEAKNESNVQKMRTPPMRNSVSSFSIHSSETSDEASGLPKSTALARIASREEAALKAENKSNIFGVRKPRTPTLRKSTSPSSSLSSNSLDERSGLPKSTALARIASREKAALDGVNGAKDYGAQKLRTPTLRTSISSFSSVSAKAPEEVNGLPKSTALARIASREKVASEAESTHGGKGGKKSKFIKKKVVDSLMRSDEKKKDLTMERRLDAMRARSKASLPPVVTTEHAVSTLMVDKNDGILKNRSAPFVRRVSKDFGLSMSAVEGRSTYQSNSNHAVPAEPRVTRINSARVLDLALTNKLDDETTSRGLEERHLGRTLSSRSEKSKFEKASVKEPAIESSLSPRRSAEKQDGNVNPANNDPVSSSNSIVFSNATIVPYKADPIQQPALTDVISIVNEEPLVRGEETCLDFGGSLVYHVSEGSTCSSSEVFLHHELSRPNYPAHERSVMAPIQTYAQDPLLPTCVSQTISVKGETMSMEATSTIQPWSQMSQGLIHSAQDSPTLDIIREIMRIETLPTDTPQKTLSLGPLPTTMSHEPTVAPSLADCLEFDPEQVTAKVSLLEQQEITLMVPKEQFSVEPLVSPMGVRKWVVWPLTAMKAIMVIIILAQAFRNGDQADFMKWGNKISKDILFVMMAFMIGAGLADVI